MDRLELRRKNFIPKEEFPFETALGIFYDSGDYHGTLDKLLEHFDLDAFRAGAGRACASRASTAAWASRPTSRCAAWRRRGRSARRGWASRRRSGSRPTCASRPPARRSSTPARRRTARGSTRASRRSRATSSASTRRTWTCSTATPTRARGAGTPTARARWRWAARRSCARRRRCRTRPSASARRCSRPRPEDIELAGGKYQVRGSPDKSMTMAEISGAAHIPPNELPADIEPGLEESSFYDPENFVFPFGAHACVVDVDAETGKVKVVRYVAVDDCGPAINPMLIDGQMHGGIVARDRAGALRAGGLRRGRPARDGHVRGLRAADGGGDAVRSRPTAPRRPRR